MSDSHKNNQRNKQIVWDYWQRMNHASPAEVPGLIRKTFHSDVNWNGPHPINQIMGIDALISDFWRSSGLLALAGTLRNDFWRSGGFWRFR